MASLFRYVFCVLFIFAASSVSSQQVSQKNERLKVFIDCRNADCDMNFIKTQITVVDFLLDPSLADVHILINSLSTGGGGRQYEMIFFGQHQFSQLSDTIVYNQEAIATAAESRELLLKYLKAGLVPFIVKTGLIADIDIAMKRDTVSSGPTLVNNKTKDPWNYWVITLRVSDNINAEQLYKNFGITGNAEVSRVTEELKLSFSTYGSVNKTIYTYQTDSSTEKFVAKTNYYGVQHYLVKSINHHWSAGYEAIFNSNTFENFRRQLYLRAAIEYNIFPYKDINSRYLTFGYGIISRFNRYYDTSIYNKLKETLFAQSFRIYFLLNKKWGAINSGLSYSNYFHDWSLNNFTMNFNVSVRISGGLSFYISSNAGLVHDQVYIAKAGATEKEVLTRLRQLKSSYYFQNSFGISYQFGSKLNNFVNPRFEGN